MRGMCFRHFPYNENPARALNTIWLKCCLPWTDAIDIQEKIHTCIWRFKVASCKRTSLKSTRFSQNKNKVRNFSNRIVYSRQEKWCVSITGILTIRRVPFYNIVSAYRGMIPRVLEWGGPYSCLDHILTYRYFWLPITTLQAISTIFFILLNKRAF